MLRTLLNEKNLHYYHLWWIYKRNNQLPLIDSPQKIEAQKENQEQLILLVKIIQKSGVDVDNEDKNVEQIRENNEGHEETSKNKTGKCGCFIY